MNRFIYSILLYLAVPFILLRLLRRSRKAPAYRQRWGERFALTGIPANFPANRQCIWIHSVSVGETLAAIPLVKSLQETWPDIPLLLTTMTPTGSDRVRESFGDSVFHCYMPYDLPGVVNRFISRIRPQLLIIMETELWPNTIYYCHRKSVKVLLANARLSEKSSIGYQRFPGLARSMLQNIDRIAAQTEADARRLIHLGADPGKVVVTGSIKFEMEVPVFNAQQMPALFQHIASSSRPVWIAASTRDGEEEQILEAFRRCVQASPGLLLILVPRHPERFNAVAQLCKEKDFLVVRRSAEFSPDQPFQILLGDSMGEMWSYYHLAQIAFVGGSLVDTGCHNVLEPAALALPVLVGPSQFNFAVICEQLEEVGALKTVNSAAELSDAVLQLLEDDQLRDTMGIAGRQLIEANRGSLKKVLTEINTLISTISFNQKN